MTTTRQATTATIAERIKAPKAASDWAPRIAAYNGLYASQGYDTTLTLVDGTHTVHVRTLGMAKRVCEDWASLLWTENTEVEAGDSDSPETLFLNTARLFGGRFNTRMADHIEGVFASGFGALELLVDGLTFRADGKGVVSPEARLSINYVDADCVIPLAWSGGVIVEAAFVSWSTDHLDVREHRREGNGYRLTNTRYTVDSQGNVAEKPEDIAEGVAPEIVFADAPPLFACYAPAIRNNLDSTSPYGLAVFANATDHLEVVDLAFNNFGNDIELSRKMLMLPTAMLRKKRDADGNPTSGFIAPTADKRSLFVAMEDEGAALGGDSMKPTEYNPSMRVEDNTGAIEAALGLLSSACGMGAERYRYRDGSVVTATQIISENDDLFRNRRKHLLAITAAIEVIARAALWAGKTLVGMALDTEAEIVVRTDDSVIEDDGTRQARGMAKVAAGVLSVQRYLVEYEGMTEKDAAAEVAMITPAVPALFG